MRKLLNHKLLDTLLFCSISLIIYHLFFYYLINILTSYYSLVKPTLTGCIKIILLNNFFIICAIFIVIGGPKSANNNKFYILTMLVIGVSCWITFSMKDMNDDLVKSLFLKDIYAYASKRFVLIFMILSVIISSFLPFGNKTNK